ncbi:MAG TPA: aminoacyl-tRNA hydrolase [Flavobacteriales bacterium]|nr:aminoacyl-tRNA hydrolase [Flavobacteriales bacterium]HIN40104.1 aminoacyl-tRNA hydrolase [Flavobacteriales bacterium]HIO40198.1 aminoacyl-tRNA hydrolase [Candidatus Neomarinimicrobiota bacterium]
MKLSGLGLGKEFQFKTSRSGGAGGQHVNKVETKVELSLDISNSAVFTEAQKQTILSKLSNRISKEGVLQITVDSERSQFRNKEIAIIRLYDLIEESLKRKKYRIPTKPSRASKRKRIKAKKILSEKKERRKKP